MKTWIKLYTEIIDDAKIGMLSLADRGIWMMLLALAGRVDDRDAEDSETGKLGALERIAWCIRCDVEELAAAAKRFESLTMVHMVDGILFVTHFPDRQARLTDAERMRYYRKNKARQEYYGTEMPPLQRRYECVTSRNEDTESESESESEKRSARTARKPSPPLPSQILAFQEAAGGRLLPRKATWPAIVKAIEDSEPALTKWRNVVTTWMGTPYSPQNINGMLDWFKNGIPENKRGTHGAHQRGNGKGQPVGGDLPSLEEANRFRECRGEPILTAEQYADIQRRVSDMRGIGLPSP